MNRRVRTVRFKCGHEGCQEVANYEVHSNDEARRLYAAEGNGKYRCVRHTRMEEVLSASNSRRTVDLANEQKENGCYWGGGSGFTYGPGFKAFAKDFPPGTILRVTAEVILPATASDDHLERAGEER